VDSGIRTRRGPHPGREGSEPDGGLSQISKLRISFEIRTPHFPSEARIWPWTNSVRRELLVLRHFAKRGLLYLDSSFGELQSMAQFQQLYRIWRLQPVAPVCNARVGAAWVSGDGDQATAACVTHPPRAF
jgi:hypothetical protein